jgi:hypothetical protein
MCACSGLGERECLPIPVHVGSVVNLEEAQHVPHTSDLVSRRHVASFSRCKCENGSTVGREIEIERVVQPSRQMPRPINTLFMSRVRVGEDLFQHLNVYTSRIAIYMDFPARNYLLLRVTQLRCRLSRF